jgi:serine/threonine protein phosphatase PrpC
MKLACALTDAGGSYNEDAFGYIEKHGEVSVAWVLDGVTGINERKILPAETDAMWFVERVQLHLYEILSKEVTLIQLLPDLVKRLITDWQCASHGMALPEGYDLPACCLLLVQKTSNGWQALRLGDSFLLIDKNGMQKITAPESNLASLEHFLKIEAGKRQQNGAYDFRSLLREFKPQLMANRKSRNKPGGYSVLEPTEASLAMPQLADLGWPSSILLCTDGFYRCVDHYAMHDDTSLMLNCQCQSATTILMQSMRILEASDPNCQTYLRFKPKDDATVVTLSLPSA